MDSNILHKRTDLEVASELAVGMAQLITRDKVKDCKIPFVLLYQELTRAKEIKPLSSLDQKEKLKYWNEVKGEDGRFRQIITAQALYTYDLITN